MTKLNLTCVWFFKLLTPAALMVKIVILRALSRNIQRTDAPAFIGMQYMSRHTTYWALLTSPRVGNAAAIYSIYI